MSRGLCSLTQKRPRGIFPTGSWCSVLLTMWVGYSGKRTSSKPSKSFSLISRFLRSDTSTTLLLLAVVGKVTDGMSCKRKDPLAPNSDKTLSKKIQMQTLHFVWVSRKSWKKFHWDSQYTMLLRSSTVTEATAIISSWGPLCTAILRWLGSRSFSAEWLHSSGKWKRHSSNLYRSRNFSTF